MGQCEICGSNNVIMIDDTDINNDVLLILCVDCNQRMFGSPPTDCSSMYI